MLNTLLKRLPLISAALLIGLLLVALATTITLAQGPAPDNLQRGFGWGHGPGMMGGWGNMGPGRMGGWRGMEPGRMGRGMGSGMMGGRGYGFMPQRGITGTMPYGYGPGDCPGMSGGWGYGYAPQRDPLTTDQAVAAVDQYLVAYNNPDLVVAEIMAFSQNFYVQVKEASSDRMAFELLVDPYTGFVRPELGPNMMWNTKYGHMAGRWADNYNTQPTAEMSLSVEEARQFAQDYLDTVLPNTIADDHADTFYGYYTLHVLQDEQIVGMLSVNGFTGQVWYHTWHGDFIGGVED